MDPAWLETIIGSTNDITWWQMSLRAVVVFLYGLFLVRISGTRAFGKSAAFDILLSVVLGSSLSRALTGNAPLIPTLIASTVLVLLHAALARLAIHLSWFGPLVKGRPVRLVEDGRVDEGALRETLLTHNDLYEGIRMSGAGERPANIHGAWLERSGDISVVPTGSSGGSGS